MVQNFLEGWQRSGTSLDAYMRDVPIMCHSIDRDGVLLNVSQFWADRLGYAPHDMIGKSSIDFLTPKSRAYAVESVLPRFYETGRISSIRYQFAAADGEIVPVIMSAIAYPIGKTPERSLAVMFDNGVAREMSELRHHAEMISEVLADIEKEIPAAHRDRLHKVLSDLQKRIDE